MDDPMNTPNPGRGAGDSFDGDIIELREEDTTPAPPSESLRRWMEQRYGRKAPPPKPPTGDHR